MSIPAAPTPKSRLGRYRMLAPTAGIKVSPLCLGAMNFGEGWKERLGECDKETSFNILDTFYENGGNFIDTANNYQNEDSEAWVGEWMEKRGVRDQIVLATKYTSGFRSHMKSEIQANFVGNNTKSMRLSVNASLKKLRTDYIDLLYVHWWDFATSIEEVMTSLNQLVTSGKVLYLGISDTPAWIVSRANQFARDHGMRPFSVYQGQWSAAKRDFEREIIPMCAAEGMGLCPWGAIGGGAFKTAAHREELAKSGNPGRQVQPRDVDVAVSKVLESVADRHKTAITSVALAYVMSKTTYVCPIVGGRKVEHLLGNIEALGLELSEEDIKEIESAYEFDYGFPMTFIFRGENMEAHPSNVTFKNSLAKFDFVDSVRPIKPKSLDA
ncbi:Norsolorinic acid reductase B [Penicillium daleae]|uniref:Norsolorinic acid reductase B n=1 Tax=Penicillium daleae TaxID=63821 RepID=A0AAD6C566_9EURO|nr:Norsolorinic acid reductase B [Penicillium daleae]KAJ5449909.1 Norsolorinic acid reductase B [Penicillium daleae]